MKSIEKILRNLEGLNTIEMIQKKLNIKKNTAIKKIHELRKLGYVKTSGGGKQPRLYSISRTKIQDIGNSGLYEVINKNSPIKIREPYNHRIVGKELSIEEAIVRAIKTKNIRVIIAVLALFNKVNDWSKLYQHAKKENVRRKVGALYDIAKTVLRVKRMDERTRKSMLKTDEKNKYIIKNMKSKSFKDIEKKWKVYIPLNSADLGRYKE